MTNPYESPKSDVLVENSEWKRSKWLTGWLWFTLITTIINIPLTYLMADAIMARSHRITMPILNTLTVCAIISAVSVIAILNNKKWGVWGICVIVAIVFGINFYTMGLKTALLGLIGLAILLFLLLKGGKNSAWSRLC